MNHFLGIDFGTSGARLMVIDDEQQLQFETAIAFRSAAAARDPTVWRTTLFQLIKAIPLTIKSLVQCIAIDGTSSTILLCDHAGRPLTRPQMYNDRGDPDVLKSLTQIAPPEHISLSLTSSLCKFLSWSAKPYFSEARFLLHQTDWLAAQLHGQWGISDYHNSLKLGFDPATLSYPDWFDSILDIAQLPRPLKPGEPAGYILPTIAKDLGLPEQVQICAGTTDSIAAFLASEASRPGDAVTSLGSTLALKLLSRTRVDASRYGVYSHWFGPNWLVGGASNAGGAVLLHFFSSEELEQLSQEIDWSYRNLPSYIPLLTPGERFPINDPNLKPCLEPRPSNPAEFLQAILVSLTRIELEGYRKLRSLGSSPLCRLFTAGGGTKNAGWMNWRKTQFEVPVLPSVHTEAAFGTAKLARGCLADLNAI